MSASSVRSTIWSVACIRLTDKVALRNFLSTFSGTHYVTPVAFPASSDTPASRDSENHLNGGLHLARVASAGNHTEIRCAENPPRQIEVGMIE